METENMLLLGAGLIILIFAIRFLWKTAASLFKLFIIMIVVIVALYAYKPTIYDSIVGQETVTKVEAGVSSLAKTSVEKIKNLF